MNKSNSKKDNISALRQKTDREVKQSKEKMGSGEIKHKLNVHEIELEMQNVELLETQVKLNAALVEYSELFELSPVGYFILDSNGIVEKVNIRGSVQLGLDKEDIVKKPFSKFLHSELDQDNFYRHMNVAIRQGTLERMECEIKKKGGAVFSAFIKSKAIRDEGLRFKHLLSMITDISRIKEHEHQIEMQLIRSEELNAMKSSFIGIASHEFRTPLTSILSSTSLIEQYLKMGEFEKTKKHLTRIKSAIKNLVTILDEFLSIEKLESGKVEIQKINFSLPELCQDLIEEISSISKKGQVIDYRHFGKKEVINDKKALQHIILNLISNACKYSAEDKEIKLFTKVTDNKITITVEDKGIGIPEAEQDNIFTKFFRAQNSGNTQGTGLGLNIVKRYVELINGTIDFVSKYNEGTTFTVEFPHR